MAVLTDPISDFLTRWKNASRAKKQEFTAPYSKIKAEIARILQEEGYIWGFEVDTSSTHPVLKVKAKYQGSTPILNDLRRMSSPGMRQYVGATEIPRVLNGMGIAILSTPKGIMTGNQAKKQNVGGELLALVW
jgi:small subunit ribosomal protein S8